MVDFMGHFIANIENLQMYIHQQEFLLQALSQLQKGELPQSLVTPQDLNNGLDKVAVQLRKTAPSYQIVHYDMAFYYNNHLAFYVYTNDNIYILINVPIAQNAVEFSLYIR